MFNAEVGTLAAILGDAASAIHHVGSTSVPGLVAKPVIDIMAEYTSAEAIDACNDALAGFGYVARGEYGIPGRRYFVKSDSGGKRSHHLHCLPARSAAVTRHLLFRDRLLASPALAASYAQLKRDIVASGAVERAQYQDAKADFIVRHSAP